MAIEIIKEMPEELRPKKAFIPILEGPPPSDSLLIEKEEPIPADLTGRTLMLNMERAQKFQCAYFLVTARRSYATVSPDCQRVSYKSLRQAIERGILIDVTDGKKGIRFNGSMVSGVHNEVDATKRRIFMGTDKYGKRYVVIPKTAEEETQYLKEIEETGTIQSVDWKEAEDVNMSPIKIYD